MLHESSAVNVVETTLEREQLKSLLAQRAEQESVARGSVISICEQGEGAPLFCIHGGGAGLPHFKQLSTYLKNQRCYGLQLTAMTLSDPVLSSVELMAKLHFRALLEFPYEGPYLLCGHSMGATVAFELAQQLRRAGRQVSLLVIIDQPGPDTRLSKLDWFYWQWVVISRLPARDRWNYVREAVRYRFAADNRLPSVLRRCFFSRKSSSEALRRGRISPAEYRRKMTDSTLEALKTYRPQPYHQPLVLFRAESSSPRIHSDPHGGWCNIAQDIFQVFEIPGHHMNIFSSPYVEVFAEKLDRCLQEYKHID